MGVDATVFQIGPDDCQEQLIILSGKALCKVGRCSCLTMQTDAAFITRG
jgi:hypothetical protein